VSVHPRVVPQGGAAQGQNGEVELIAGGLLDYYVSPSAAKLDTGTKHGRARGRPVMSGAGSLAERPWGNRPILKQMAATVQFPN